MCVGGGGVLRFYSFVQVPVTSVKGWFSGSPTVPLPINPDSVLRLSFRSVPQTLPKDLLHRVFTRDYVS